MLILRARAFERLAGRGAAIAARADDRGVTFLYLYLIPHALTTALSLRPRPFLCNLRARRMWIRK